MRQSTPLSHPRVLHSLSPIALAMGTMGVVFLISQVLILQEFLLLFQGNEFSIGLVLSSWLLLEALGSRLAGDRAEKSPDPVRSFVTLQVVLSLLFPATLVLIKLGRSFLGISPWEALSLLSIWGLSILLPAPLGILNGASFTYGCRLMRFHKDNHAQASGMVYTLESVGAFVGGLAFTFILLGRFHGIKIAFLLGVLSMITSFLLLDVAVDAVSRDRISPHPGLKRLCLLLALFFLSGLLLPLADYIYEQAGQHHWSPLKLMKSRESVYGNISVLATGDESVVYQNGLPAITMPQPNIAAIEELVHLPLLAHGKPQSLLFIGGAIGGALAEAQKHPLNRIVYAELDPLLLHTAKQYASSKVLSELDDPRTSIRYLDGRFFLRENKAKFDIVIINLPDALTLQLNRFFTMEFFSLVSARLNESGLLAFTLPGSEAYLSNERIRINRCVRDTLQQVFAHVRILPGERNLFLASRGIDVEALTSIQLNERRKARRIAGAVVGAAYLNDKMSVFRERWIQEALQRQPDTRLNRDFSPALVYYVLADQNAEVQPGLRNVIEVLEKVRLKVLVPAVMLLNLPLIIFFLRRRNQYIPAIFYSIFSTGIVGMTLELVVILVFQSVYGYLYHWIGLLIASFMAGLAVGAWMMTGRLERLRNGYLLFCFLECGQLGLIILAALTLKIFPDLFLQGALPVYFCMMNLLAGFWVGLPFPLACQEAGRFAGPGPAALAGRFYALDLAGAWAGTLLVGVFLIPLIGIESTLWLAAILKTGSLICLFSAR